MPRFDNDADLAMMPAMNTVFLPKHHVSRLSKAG
jgi:hypothetical protein